MMKAIKLTLTLFLVFTLNIGAAFASGENAVEIYRNIAQAMDEKLNYPDFLDREAGLEISVIVSYSISENNMLEIHEVGGGNKRVTEYIIKQLQGVYIEKNDNITDGLNYVKVNFRLL